MRVVVLLPLQPLQAQGPRPKGGGSVRWVSSSGAGRTLHLAAFQPPDTTPTCLAARYGVSSARTKDARQNATRNSRGATKGTRQQVWCEEAIEERRQLCWSSRTKGVSNKGGRDPFYLDNVTMNLGTCHFLSFTCPVTQGPPSRNDVGTCRQCTRLSTYVGTYCLTHIVTHTHTTPTPTSAAKSGARVSSTHTSQRPSTQTKGPFITTIIIIVIMQPSSMVVLYTLHRLISSQDSPPGSRRRLSFNAPSLVPP